MGVVIPESDEAAARRVGIAAPDGRRQRADAVPTDPDDPRRLIGWTIAVVAATVATLWALYLARQVLMLVYVSALLAVGMSPIVERVERRRMLLPQGWRRPPRWLATLIVYLVILGSLFAAGMLVVPSLAVQGREFARGLPAIVAHAQSSLVQRGLLSQPLTVHDVVEQAPGSDVVGTVFGTVWGLVGGLVGVFTILVLTFYLLVGGDEIAGAFVRLFPRTRRAQVRAASSEVTRKVSGWLGGQLILGAAIGGSSALWLGLLGVPYFWVLALIAAMGELVPYVGPLLAAVPGIVVALTISTRLAVIAAALYFIQQQLESSILAPKILERQVGVSPIVVILAVLIGSAILGVVGALLAVPTAAILQVIVQELTADEG